MLSREITFMATIIFIVSQLYNDFQNIHNQFIWGATTPPCIVMP